MPRGIVSSFTRFALRGALFLGLVGGGSVGVWYYVHHQSAAFQIQQLEMEKKRLQATVQRLTEEKRVAKVLVTDQRTIAGELQTTLLFVEYARDGSTLPPKQFTIVGNIAHLDAMVIKFDHGFVADDDPLRGHSIALFCRLYGEKQTPEAGFRIDSPGEIPDVYRGDVKQAADQAAFEKDLWQNFWRLPEDKKYAESKGVRVANGQGLWGPFSPDRVYTITIESDGGLNLKSDPMEGLYREALRQKLSEPKSPATVPSVTRTE